MTKTQPVLIDQHGEFGSKSFKPVAVKIWTEFFRVGDSSCDLMHWMIDGFSSTVRATGRRIDMNECSPEWETSQPIVAIVDGFFESMAEGESVPNPSMLAEFKEWVACGIMEAFAMKRIEKKFFDLEFANDGFVVATSPTDEGLAEDELEVLWASDQTLTPAAIKARQIAAQKGKRHKVRKKKN